MTSRNLGPRRFVALVLALLLGAGISCSRPETGLDVSSVALTTLDDGTVELTAGGAPSLVVFFAIDNPFALKTLEQLDGLLEEYSDRELRLIAVALSSERPGLVRSVVHRQRFLFPVAMDPSGTAAAAFGGVTATPTVFVVSPDGRVVERLEGAANIGALRATIADL